MNENVNFFKDQKEQLMNAVEKAMLQVEIMQDIFPGKALDKLLVNLSVIKSLYPGYFKQFILSQCIENGKLATGEFNLDIGGDNYFKITVEIKDHKKDVPSASVKTKLYHFL